MARSYAQALASEEETNEETNTTNKKETLLEQTFVLYKIEPENISTNDVIKDIATSLRVNAPTAIFGVHKDTRYRSRFTVVFQSKIYIQQIKENGLQVGTTKIAPKRTKPTRGYLPNLPVYALEQEVRELLTNHGNVVGLYPRTRNDGIRIGGWNFYIHLESHNSMPEFLLYDNEKYEIIHANQSQKKN